MARRDIRFARKSETAVLTTDHGSLSGLSDDDHTQYHTDARALTWLQSQNVSELTNDSGYLTSISGLNNSLLTNDSGYITSIAGESVTDLDGTAYRILLVDSAGDVTELAHGTSGHVLTSNGASSDPSWQAAGGGSSLTYTQDGATFAELLTDAAGSNVVARSYQFGMQFAPENGQTLGALEFWDTGYSNQHAALITNLFTSGLTLRNNQHGGHVRLDAEDTGGTATTMINADPDGSVDLYFDADLVFKTRSQGVELWAPTTNPQLRFLSNAGADLRGIVFYDDANNQMVMDARETANSGVALYHTGTSVLQKALDSDGTALNLYYDGDNVFSTTSQGAQFTATTGVAGVLEISADTGQATAVNMEEGATTKAQFGYFPGNSYFRMRVSDSGDDILLTNVADGDMARFNGGGAVSLYFGGSLALETISGSIKFGTHTTLGAETVTGYITVQDSAGNTRKLAVVS